MASRTRSWLQLFRAPNLFTVPGDPLAGFLLASSGELEWSAVLAVAAALCFYSAGLLHNDLVDLQEDQRDRPTRPLPSGSIAPRSASVVAALLVALGLAALAAFREILPLLLGVLTVAAVFTYNRFTKRLPVIGALNMGVCRGLSVLIGGASAVAFRDMDAGPQAHLLFSSDAAIAAALVTGYIALVTNLARLETHKTVAALPKLLPVLALVPGPFALIWSAQLVSIPEEIWGRVTGMGMLILALVACGLISYRLVTRPTAPIPPAIGEFIRLLIVVQAAFCAYSGTAAGQFAAIVLLVAWPLSRAVSKHFYGS